MGSHIVASLHHNQRFVRAVVRNPDRAVDLAAAGCEVATADVLDRPALTLAFQGCASVIANAALCSGFPLEASQRVNVDGVENTLRACADAGVTRVVLVSTVAVYRSRLWRPMGEDAPLAPTGKRERAWRDLTTDWRYSLTKGRGEALAWALAEELGLELTTVRPGPIYGPGDDKLSARLVDGLSRTFAVLPTVGLPLVHARDVADATVAALDRPQSIGHAYNLAGAPVPISRLVSRLVHVAGRGPRVLPIPVPVWVAFDCKKAERDLGFKARSLDMGLRSILESNTLNPLCEAPT